MPKRILLYASQVKQERRADEAPLHHGGWGESRVTPPDQVCMRNGRPKIITALNNFPRSVSGPRDSCCFDSFCAGHPINPCGKCKSAGRVRLTDGGCEESWEISPLTFPFSWNG